MIREIKELKLEPIEKELEKTIQELNSRKSEINKIQEKIYNILGYVNSFDNDYNVEKIREDGEKALDFIKADTPDVRHPSLKYSFMRKAFYSKKRI